MMIRKFIATMALALFAVTSYASQTTIDTKGLSEAQVAELKAHAAKVVADAANNAGGVSNPKEVGAMVTLASTWGQQAAAAAEGFSKAITIAAKELGITVNEFLKTDAGKLTAALIVWKVAGASIIGMLYACVLVIVGQLIARVIYLRLFTAGYKDVPYERFFGMFKGSRQVRVPKGFSQLENDGEWLAFWAMIIISLGTLFIGGVLIT